MDPVPTAATSALEELLEVSPQVDVAVILEREGGRLIASAPVSSAKVAGSLGDIFVKLLDAAERSRTELGREPIAQVEVATPDGHVFVVADARWIVAAVTSADPTVGLVFYDLKTALRAVRDAGPSDNGAIAARPLVDVSTTADAETEANATADAPTSAADESSSTPTQSRWRRKKS